MKKNRRKYVNQTWTKTNLVAKIPQKRDFHFIKKIQFIAALTIGITRARGRSEGNYASDRAFAKAVSN